MMPCPGAMSYWMPSASATSLWVPSSDFQTYRVDPSMMHRAAPLVDAAIVFATSSLVGFVNTLNDSFDFIAPAFCQLLQLVFDKRRDGTLTGYPEAHDARIDV